MKGVSARLPQSKRLSDGREHKVGIAYGSQGRKADAICEFVHEVTRNRKSAIVEAGLFQEGEGRGPLG